MLLEVRGAGAAASGDTEFRAPPCTGPLRVRAPEVPEAVRIASPCLGAPMRRGHRRRASTGLGSLPYSHYLVGVRGVLLQSLVQRWRRSWKGP
jgi:hypothetical protein